MQNFRYQVKISPYAHPMFRIYVFIFFIYLYFYMFMFSYVYKPKKF